MDHPGIEMTGPGGSRAAWLYTTAGAWAVSYVGALLALKKLPLAAPLATVVAIVPIVPFVLFLREFVGFIQRADELERRVQLEALAIAFPTALVGLMLLGLLQLAIPLSPHDWSYRHVWTFLPAIYFVCVALVWRRYR
jgi:hypothetical protein